MSLYDSLGKRMGDFSNAAYSWSGFSSGPYQGQCVTYIRGRAKEKLGVEFLGGFDSAKQIVEVAKQRGYKTGRDAAADSFIVFNDGRYPGDVWGHAYFCEGISGDDYFYTEANSNNDAKVSADDGILKKGSLKALLADKSFLGFVYLKSQNATSTQATAKETAVSGKIEFKKGLNYTLSENVNVRYGAGTGFARKLRTELTPDGMAHALQQQYACLKAGTVVTAQEIKKISDREIWAKIPSGWIAIMFSGEIYVTVKRSVTADVLNVREKASTSAKITGTLKRGQTVTVTAVSSEWGKISGGWIHLGYTAQA